MTLKRQTAFAKLLKASDSDKNVFFEVFVPNKDKYGVAYDDYVDDKYHWLRWIDRSKTFLSLLGGGGCTTELPVDSSYERKDGQIIDESTVRVYTYTSIEMLERNRIKLKIFLHAFGI